MACRKHHFGVRGDQREFGFRVIERLDARPALFAVASLALVAQAAFVGFGRLVAIDTPAGGGAKFLPHLMTAFAPCFGVGPFEAKIRERMIERLPIQPNDVGSSACVIGVAGPAFALHGIGPAAMKSAFLFAIRGDVLVAGQARFGLAGAHEGFVTAGAVLLELGMTFDQRSRHDHALEHRLRPRNPHRHQQERNRHAERQHRAKGARPASVTLSRGGQR